MKRDIRNTKTDTKSSSSFPGQTLQSVAKYLNLKLIDKTLFPKFDELNAIECDLDNLLLSIKNADDCYDILDKVKLANKIAENVYKVYKAQTKSCLRSNQQNSYNQMEVQVYIELLSEFNLMLDDINKIGLQAKIKLRKFKTNDLPLEKIILPSIEDYAALTQTKLKKALQEDKATKEVVDEILKENSKLLIEALRGDNTTSVLTQKHYGLVEHYFEILRQNDALSSIVNEIDKEKAALLALQAELETDNNDLRAKILTSEQTNKNLLMENKQLIDELKKAQQLNEEVIAKLIKDNEALKAQTAEQFTLLAQENNILKKKVVDLTEQKAVSDDVKKPEKTSRKFFHLHK